jgi:hypothetical protein
MAGIKTINALIHRLRRGIKAGNEWGGGGWGGSCRSSRLGEAESSGGGKRRKKTEEGRMSGHQRTRKAKTGWGVSLRWKRNLVLSVFLHQRWTRAGAWVIQHWSDPKRMEAAQQEGGQLG